VTVPLNAVSLGVAVVGFVRLASVGPSLVRRPIADAPVLGIVLLASGGLWLQTAFTAVESRFGIIPWSKLSVAACGVRPNGAGACGLEPVVGVRRFAPRWPLEACLWWHGYRLQASRFSNSTRKLGVGGSTTYLVWHSVDFGCRSLQDLVTKTNKRPNERESYPLPAVSRPCEPTY
jgi:hypothetical protein